MCVSLTSLAFYCSNLLISERWHHHHIFVCWKKNKRNNKTHLCMQGAYKGDTTVQWHKSHIGYVYRSSWLLVFFMTLLIHKSLSLGMKKSCLLKSVQSIRVCCSGFAEISLWHLWIFYEACSSWIVVLCESFCPSVEEELMTIIWHLWIFLWGM